MAGVKKSSSSSWAQSAPCSIWRQWNFSQSYFTKRSKVGACFIASCNWETMKSFCSHRGVEWHENWQNKYAGGTAEERWGYLGPTISHLFPSFISHHHKECFGPERNQLWAGTGHTNWFTALGQKCVPLKRAEVDLSKEIQTIHLGPFSFPL